MTLDKIKSVMPCTCGEEYTSRSLSAPDCAFCNYGEDILALSLPDKAAEKQTEENFLKFHSGYYGEVVDNIKQIAHHCFTGEELLEYLQAYTASLQAGAGKILEFAKGEEKPYGYLFDGKFYKEFEAKNDRYKAIELYTKPVREEWISTKERLPKTEGYYLVYYAKYSAISTCYYYSGLGFNNDRNTKITHWLPLPPKPTEI